MNAIAVTTKNKTAFASATRVNTAFTASLEKRALTWMAARMPRWVSSDGLTAMGLIAQIGAGASYILVRWNQWGLAGVIVCIVMNWFGDSMDGTLARVRGQQRPRYGFYVDHMVDVFGAIVMMTGLACSGMVHWQVAMAMLVGFLMLACESYLATYALGQFELAQGKLGPTELRIGLIAGNLALLRSPFVTILGHRLLLFDLGGTIAAAGMAAIAIIVTARHTAQLFQQEPLA